MKLAIRKKWSSNYRPIGQQSAYAVSSGGRRIGMVVRIHPRLSDWAAYCEVHHGCHNVLLGTGHHRETAEGLLYDHALGEAGRRAG